MSYFENNKMLVEEFTTELIFENAVAGEFSTKWDGIMYPTEIANSMTSFIKSLSNAIYRFFKRDKLAYLDKDVFLERIVYTLAENINRYFSMKQIDFYLEKDDDLSKYVLTSKVSSSSNEKGNTSNTTIQSTAQTPTGVSPTATGDELSVLQETDSDGKLTSTTTNSAYVDQYTNFQGKTNGLHQNDVNRQGDMKRVGNYLTAIEMLNNLPRTYINEVLHDVCEHFIMIY